MTSIIENLPERYTLESRNGKYPFRIVDNELGTFANFVHGHRAQYALHRLRTSDNAVRGSTCLLLGIIWMTPVKERQDALLHALIEEALTLLPEGVERPTAIGVLVTTRSEEVVDGYYMIGFMTGINDWLPLTDLVHPDGRQWTSNPELLELDRYLDYYVPTRMEELVLVESKDAPIGARGHLIHDGELRLIPIPSKP